MRGFIRLSCLACVVGLVGVSAEAAEPKLSLKEILSQQVGPVFFERTDVGRLLEKVAEEIHTPILIDERARQNEESSPGRIVKLSEPAQTADQLLTAALKSISRENRFCFTATTDKFGRVELLFTTRRAANAQGLLVVPDALPFDPTSVRVAVAFEKNTLENGLLMICLEIGANLRLDARGLAKAELPLTRLFGVRIEGRSASAALDEMLEQFDPSGSVGYLFTSNADKKTVVVVGTRRRLEEFGPWPDVGDFQDIAEQTPPAKHYASTLRAPLRWVAESLAKPVTGESRPMTLAAALELISRAANLPIDVSVVDLEIAGITRKQLVTFDPRGREVRAVLYDVLRQADPDKQAALVACVERRKDDTFALLVTTRLAANSAGRSLLSDYNLSPDDIKSGDD